MLNLDSQECAKTARQIVDGAHTKQPLSWRFADAIALCETR
jgi:hypothetical protein